MCGIIGRISLDSNPTKTLRGLKKLEYRGYDSYGILLSDNIVRKDIGELPLETLEELKGIKSNIEIGHTRWSTHGLPSQENAHPHFDSTKQFFIVMNGIIENFVEIKEEFNLDYENDTRLLPFLFSKFYTGDLIETTKLVLSKLRGDFSFILKFENQLICYKNANPIILGYNKDEILLCSDLNYLQSICELYCLLEDEDICFLTLNSDSITTTILDSNFEPIQRAKVKCDEIIEDDFKETQYFMEKEILEQANLRKVLTEENFESIDYLLEKINDKPLFLFGAGTSYHAAYYLHYQLLKVGIYSNVIIASECPNYIQNIKDSIVLSFSQSGETADLIGPLKVLSKNNELICVTNTPNSTLDRLSSRSIYLNCGKEIGVASTKAFTAQATVGHIILSKMKNNDVHSFVEVYEKMFYKTLEENKEKIDLISSTFKNSKSFFFIGRNQWYPIALEGALKLKEISYIFAEGFAGGELKHGSLALIEEGTPVIVLGDSEEIISNAIEIKTRGGIIIGISNSNNPIYDYHLKIPKVFDEIYSTILMQVIAMKVCLNLEFNPDKPRNLAKSVTVK